MENFVLHLKSQTASFRNPEFQNFHKSLELPPPTTIIGIAGAALGLSPHKAQEFFDESDFKFGIYGIHQGKCTDTWKYDKRHSNRGLRYDPEIDGSVIKRELLFDTNFLIAFASTNEKKVNRLYSAFNSPVYALTMGNSDSLAFIKAVVDNIPEAKTSQVKHCLLPGNIVDEVMKQAPTNLEFSIYQSSEPITFDLPIRFNYESDYGKRSIRSISTFSFVNKGMKLNYEVDGLQYLDFFIPLFDA